MMRQYYALEPEVAGGLGAGTVMDRSVHPPRVSKLHYQLDGWLGDQIIESFPCFVITQGLAERFRQSAFTGIEFAEVEVTKTEQFAQTNPSTTLPAFVWLKISGAAGNDDFGIGLDSRLIVSDSVYRVIQSTSPRGLTAEPVV